MGSAAKGGAAGLETGKTRACDRSDRRLRHLNRRKDCEGEGARAFSRSLNRTFSQEGRLRPRARPRRAQPPALRPEGVKRIAFVLTATVCAAKARLPDDRGHHLPNGCVPEAILFLQRYRKEHPQEVGEVICFSEKENGQVYGHSIALFSLSGRIAFWDHELGACETPLMVAQWNRSADLPKIKKRYLALVARKKDRIRRGIEAPPAAITGESKDWVLLAVRRLSEAGIDALVVKLVTGDYAATFAYNGLQWVYFPRSGAAWVRPDGKKTRKELIADGLAELDLRGHFEVLKIVP